jgi:hypothetical protein
MRTVAAANTASGRNYARAVKATVAPPTASQGLLDAVIGGVTGFIAGGPAGALAGAVAGATKKSTPAPTPTSLVPTGPVGCPSGQFLVNGTCVNLGAALPGGAPLTYPVSGTQVAAGGGVAVGAWGVPAYQPAYLQQTKRMCPRGTRLGRDGLCYPKALLGRNSPNRAWPAGRKPLFTGGELASLRKAQRVMERAKGYGLALKSTPKGKPGPTGPLFTRGPGGKFKQVK